MTWDDAEQRRGARSSSQGTPSTTWTCTSTPIRPPRGRRGPAPRVTAGAAATSRGASEQPESRRSCSGPRASTDHRRQLPRRQHRASRSSLTWVSEPLQAPFECARPRLSPSTTEGGTGADGDDRRRRVDDGRRPPLRAPEPPARDRPPPAAQLRFRFARRVRDRRRPRRLADLGPRRRDLRRPPPRRRWPPRPRHRPGRGNQSQAVFRRHVASTTRRPSRARPRLLVRRGPLVLLAAAALVIRRRRPTALTLRVDPAHV